LTTEETPVALIELEIEPLVVAPIGHHEVVADTPAAELELDPIMVEPLFPRPGVDTTAPAGIPAAEQSCVPAPGPEPAAGEPARSEAERMSGEATAETTGIEIAPPAAAPDDQLAAMGDTSQAPELDPIVVALPVASATGALPATETAEASQETSTIEVAPVSEPADHPPGVIGAELVLACPGVPAGEITLFFEEPAPASKPSSAENIPVPAVAATAELEVEVLSAAGEIAAAPSNAGETASPAPAEPPATMSEAEPADFLLEPLPPPIASSAPMRSDPVAAAQPPAESLAGAIREIEQELFVAAPEDAASDAPVEQPPLQPKPPREPIQQPAAPAGAMVVAIPEQIPLTTAAVTAPTLAIAPLVAPLRPIAKPMPRPAPSDPLAALRAMSDEERIALFS
jgi:hypothetical protein